MTKADRDRALALLKRLRERELITEDIYIAACNSEVFDEKNLSPMVEPFESEAEAGDEATDEVTDEINENTADMRQ